MAREGKQKGERVMWGSVLLPSPAVQPKVEVQGNAARAEVAGISLLQSSWHCASLSPGCGLRSDGENLQREYILHLLTSATSKPPSLTSCADLPVDPRCRRPTVPSHATTCPRTSSTLPIFFPADGAQRWQAGILLLPLCLSCRLLPRKRLSVSM